MTTEEDQEFIGALSRHLVGLSGVSRDIRNDVDLAFAYSGCVVTVKGRFYILTAGHAIKQHIRFLREGRIRVSNGILVDSCGSGAIHRDALPFNIADRSSWCIDEGSLGIDYALFRLTDLETRVLQQNNIDPFVLCPTTYPSEDAFYHFYILGFPAERVLLESASSEHDLLAMQPHCIPIERLPDDSTPYRRFHGKILDLGQLKSIEGISGGPLFGFYFYCPKLSTLIYAQWW